MLFVSDLDDLRYLLWNLTLIVSVYVDENPCLSCKENDMANSASSEVCSCGPVIL